MAVIYAHQRVGNVRHLPAHDDTDPALADTCLVLVLAGLAGVDGLGVARVPGQGVHVTRHNNRSDGMVSRYLKNRVWGPDPVFLIGS